MSDIIELSVTPDYLDSSEKQDEFVKIITELGCIKVGGSFFSGDYAPTHVFLCDRDKHLPDVEKLVAASNNAFLRVNGLNKMFRSYAYTQIASPKKLNAAKERYADALEQLRK